jgi:hypothetical protein
MRKVFSDHVCAGLAQLFLGGTLANLLGRLWALRVSIAIMIVGVYVSEPCKLGPISDPFSVVQVVPNTFGVLILGRLLT